MNPIIPTAKQMVFHNSVAHYDEVGFGGARGGAKSFSLCHEGLRQSLEWPGNVGVIVRRDLVDLRETTMHVMERYVLPPYQEQGLRTWWRGGNRPELKIAVGNQVSTILWRDTKDVGNLMSGNLGWIGLDEATEISEEFVLMVRGALGRCRLADGRMPVSKFFWASNPGAGWPRTDFPVGTVARKRTAHIEVNGEKRTITRAFIPAIPRDNPHLAADFEAKLRAVYPEAWVRRYLDGSWDVFEGQIFSELNESKHVRAFDVPAVGIWREFAAMDWGHVNPACFLMFGVDYDGRVFVWGEHYKSGLRPAQHTEIVKPRLKARKISIVQADPSCWGRERDGGTVAQEFMDAGIILTQANNDVAGGIQYIKRLFADDMIVIHPECVNLIREAKEYRWAPQTASASEKSNAPEEPVKKDDHAVDALRYGANYMRMGGLPAPQITTPDQFLERRMDQILKQSQQKAERGRW